MEDGEKVKSWYNTFSKNQLETGVNLRHHTIMNYLYEAGFKSNSKVLEIGCGIGTLTGLLFQNLPKGKLVAADISDESIKIAKERIPNADKIDFYVTDMKDFTYPEKFDFIVLPDVMEHIPVEQHPGLFKTIEKHMHDDSIILINIPHPKALDYIRINTPEKLQIIDQSIGADTLISNAYANNLILTYYKAYSIFNEEADYVLVKFKKNISYKTLTPLDKNTIIKNKLAARANTFFK